MVTGRSPGTGNVGVSRLAVAQRPKDDSNMADVVHPLTPRVLELAGGVDSANCGAGRPTPSSAVKTTPRADAGERWVTLSA